MPRVRWSCTILYLIAFWANSVLTDCWYDDEKHEEGVDVATAEPCLNCTCSRGALLCYLRVCPRLPNPPPPGCILLHRYRTCCPELICTDIQGGGNGLEARSEPDGIDLPYDTTVLGNACISNGSIYGAGSAMSSSSLCEYCYCLAGKETCVKPKCLLSIEGCSPMYESTNCCPVHYNCTSLPSTSTTTIKPKDTHNGCIIDNAFYNEGQKVLGVGHSVCDNCYCLRGILRCEPLSCAPPLLGCTPVIKPGECCAASYNCSGTIEIQTEPNYGQFPIVSKEYAKLRKEVHQPPFKKSVTESNAPFYVIAETTKTAKHRSPGTFGTTRHFTGVSFNPSTTKPFYYNSMMEESLSVSENKHSTRSYPNRKFGGVYYATTNYEFQNTNYKRPFSTTNKPKTSETTMLKLSNSITTTGYKEQEKLKSSDYLGLTDEAIFSIVDSLLDGRLNRRVESQKTETTTDIEEKTTEQTTEVEESTTDETTVSMPVTFRNVLNSTDCIDSNDVIQKRNKHNEVTTVLPIDANEINKLAEFKEFEQILSTTSDEDFSTETTTDDVTNINLENRIKMGIATTVKSSPPPPPELPPEIEAILNITKTKEDDYEYDYNEPTLPPSLPNLRIIPFVAADALDSKLEKDNAVYPQERVTDDTSYDYTNRFSPPIETEGGFIPKEPPIYENTITVPSITNAPKSNEINCISDGREVIHGQSVASESPCLTCTCFYGNIVCQKVACPIPRPACRKSTVQDLALCCPHYVCDDEEAPTVVLDRLEGTLNPQKEVPIVDDVNAPDPFRNVIRTEPAPDLQSLMVDMMPFLARKTTPLTTTTTTTTTATVKPLMNDTDNDGLLDKVLQLLFSTNKETQKNHINSTTTTDPELTTASPSITEQQELETRENAVNEEENNKVDSLPVNSHLGMLRLAGCNIYGRMYRVGRIISELSNPCLECKCTEVGVQCRPLKC